MEKLATRLVVVAVLVIAALGVYVFNLRESLDQANTTIALATQNRDDFRHKLEALTKTTGAAVVALNTCTTQLKDDQAKLDAATKHSGRPQKH
ncbi:MAG: hypothetical protein EPO08_13790 [Rhodospirillaceae bacterium]|nr:MAG: hypothetical protein EPO08_13790 [Rhodospirillaceae bacterium]